MNLSGIFSKLIGGINFKTYLYIITFSIVIGFLAIISTVSYKTTTSTILKRTETIYESNLIQINNKVNLSIGEYKKLVKNFSEDKELKNNLNMIRNNIKDNLIIMQTLNDIKIQLSKLKLPYNDISSIEIYSGGLAVTDDERVMSSVKTEIKSSSIYDKLVSANGNVCIFEPLIVRDDYFINGFRGITFACMIFENGHSLGTIFVIMKSQWLNNVFKNEKDAMILSQNSNFILWSSNLDISKSYNMFKDQFKYKEGRFAWNNYDVLYVKANYNDWTIFTFKNIKDITAPFTIVRNKILLAAMFSLLLSFLTARVISSSITKPILELMRIVKKHRVSGNDLNDEYYKPIKKRRLTLAKMLNLYFISVVILPMIVYISFFYFSLSSVIESKVKESVLLTFKQTVDNIDAFIAINERISVKIIADDNIQDFLVNDYENPTSYQAEYRDKIGEVIDNNLALSESIFQTSLYSVDKSILFSTSYFNKDEKMGEELSIKSINSYGDPIWLEYDFDRYNRNVVKLVRKVYALNNDKYAVKNIGFISMTYYESNIEELYRDVNIPDSKVYLIDKSGMIISHRTKTLINQKSDNFPENNFFSEGSKITDINGKPFLVIYASCTKLPWTLIGVIDYKQITKDTFEILAVNLYIILILLIAAVLLSYLFSRIMILPINRLKSKLALVGDGIIEVNFFGNTSINEMDELGKAFNLMTSRINKLIEREYISQLKFHQLENEKKDSEMIALQAQINPHFLYNTMETIKCLINRSRKKEAEAALTNLADLFRFGISHENMMITVEEEMKYLRAYIDIQKLRLGNKVKFWWSVDKNTLCYMIPRLIIQPLIENAIKHGAQRKDETVNINIFCSREGNLIVFKVMDDGMGIEKTDLQNIRNALNGVLTGSSIGIFNVQKRIQLSFGKDYGITIESSHEIGTIVRITVPIIVSIGGNPEKNCQ